MKRFRVKVSPPDPLTQSRLAVVWGTGAMEPIGVFALSPLDYMTLSLSIGNLLRLHIAPGPGEIRALIMDTGQNVSLPTDD